MESKPTMRMPSKCPSCGGELAVTRLECSACGATIEGSFNPCPACMLGDEDRELFDLFMWARGNVKEIQRELGVSYPTVRARIERMFERYEQHVAGPHTPMEVLRMVRTGDINVDEAEEMLRRGVR